MKTIPISSGLEVLVDDVVHEWLNWYKWSVVNTTPKYALRKVVRETDGINRVVYLHRIISGLPTEYRICFINGNTLDCRHENLRTTSKAGKVIEWEGSCGASTFNGVIWDGRYGLWRAHLDGMIIGYYITEIDAARGYNSKAIKFLPETVNDLSFL